MSALKIAINVLAVLSLACATTDEPDVCQAPLSSAEWKLRSPPSNRADFISFAALSFGATREDVLERFGEPEWIDGIEDPEGTA